jgi:hypothetical protein
MAHAHEEPRLVFVFHDGEGEYYLRIQAVDNSTQLWPLTQERALHLAEKLIQTARDIQARSAARA